MRNVTDAFIAACNAQETSEGFYILVTINHEDLDEPIYLNNSGATIVSRGLTFLACPIQITLSDDSEDKPPQAKIILDNIDQEIIEHIRSIITPPIVDLELVKDSDLDTVEASFEGFELRSVDYNVLTIEGTLTLDNIYSEPSCSYLFTPTYFPGLF